MEVWKSEISMNSLYIRDKLDTFQELLLTLLAFEHLKWMGKTNFIVLFDPAMYQKMYNFSINIKSGIIQNFVSR